MTSEMPRSGLQRNADELRAGVPRHAATSTPSPKTSAGSATGSTGTPAHPATAPTNRIPPPEGWAPVGHTHDTPQLPRWVRYLAWVLAALTALTIVLSVLVSRTDQRLDRVESRLDAVCRVLASLPEDTANARALRQELDCPQG